MVAARVLGDISRFGTYCTRTETLNEWINTVRYKKGVIRRQRKNRDLRVAAVLTTAIQRAEIELRRKQAERAQRWAQVRAQYGGGGGGDWGVTEAAAADGGGGGEGESPEEGRRHCDSSWNDRETLLCSGGGASDKDTNTTINSNNNNSDYSQMHCSTTRQRSQEEEMDEEEAELERAAEEVAKLWSSELMGLDSLFNDLNQIKTVVAR